MSLSDEHSFAIFLHFPQKMCFQIWIRSAEITFLGELAVKLIATQQTE